MMRDKIDFESELTMTKYTCRAMTDASRRLLFSRTKTLTSVFASICAVFMVSMPVKSETVLKRRIEPWGLYCFESNEAVDYKSCSLAVSLMDKEDPSINAKLGVSVASPDGEMQLTIKIPKIRHIKSGVSILGNSGMFLKAYFDECEVGGCVSTVRLDDFLLGRLMTADKGWVEYQISEDSTARLQIKLDSFGEAVTSLYRAVNIGGSSGFTIASGKSRDPKTGQPQSSNLVVEIRKDPTNAIGDHWGDLATCKSAEQSKMVTVLDDLKIADAPGLERWVSNARQCLEGSVVWIRSASGIASETQTESKAVKERLQFYQVYNALKDSSSPEKIVFSSNYGVPMRIDTQQ